MTARGDKLRQVKAEHVPKVSALELVECATTEDLGTKAGKQALWRMLATVGTARKVEFELSRNRYLAQRFGIADANRQAALDIAADLPTAHDLPRGLLESLRMGSDVQEPVGGVGKWAREDEKAAENLAASGAMLAEGAAEAGPDIGTGPPSASGRRTISPVTRLDTLYDRVEELTKGKPQPGLGACIVWVSTNIGRRLERMDPEDVPGLRALSMWHWAKKNETEFRKREEKLIPAKGLADEDTRGYIDDGTPITEILASLEEIKGSLSDRRSSDVQVRVVPEAVSSCDDHHGDGGVHDVPEPVAPGGQGSGPGAAGGHGGDVDGESGAVGCSEDGVADRHGEAPLPGDVTETGHDIGRGGYGPDECSDIPDEAPTGTTA